MDPYMKTPFFRAPSFFFSLLVIPILAGMVFLERLGCSILQISPAPGPAFQYGGLLFPAFALGCIILGTIIAHHQRRNRIAWTLILGGLGVLLYAFGNMYGICGLTETVQLPFYREVLWLSIFGQIPIMVLLFFLPLIFPTGQYLSNRWRLFYLISMGGLVIILLILSFLPGTLNSGFDMGIEIDNPFGLITINLFPGFSEMLASISSTISLCVMIAAFSSLFVRWRRSGQEVRQQIKWLVFFLASVGSVFIAVEFIGLFLEPEIFNSWFYLVELSFFWMGFPIVLAIILFKYRLYDIDFIIRKTLQYAMLTGILALVYFGSITLLQSISTAVFGLQSPVFVVISTLAIAALFNPLRTRFQDFIDRRFYRTKYVGEQSLARFAETARDEVDMDKLTFALMDVVNETMQPESLHLMVHSTGGKSK